MLEFKNVDIDGRLQHLSFVVRAGEILAIKGGRATGKTTIANVILGRQPVRSGYVTIDGELVTVGAAPYFRKNIGYVPYDIDFPLQKFGDLVSAMTEISEARGRKCTRQNVIDEMNSFGIAAGYMDTDIRTADKSEMRLAMVAICAAMGGCLLVADSHVSMADERFSKALRLMAQRGWAVVVTENDNYIDCDKKIDLDAMSANIIQQTE